MHYPRISKTSSQRDQGEPITIQSFAHFVATLIQALRERRRRIDSLSFTRDMSTMNGWRLKLRTKRGGGVVQRGQEYAVYLKDENEIFAHPLCRKFTDLSEASSYHDIMARAKYGEGNGFSGSYFLGKADHELLWKRQLETFQALLSSQCRRRDQIYQVAPLQKNGGSNNLPLRMHDESVYHLGLGDMSRGLGKDFAGRCMVLLSTNFCAEPPPTSVVTNLTGSIHGRGMRVFRIPAAQTKDTLRSLGLRTGKQRTNTSEVLIVSCI